MSLEDALMERLRIIDCKPEDLARFVQAHPPQSRLTEVRAWNLESTKSGMRAACDRDALILPSSMQGIQELVTALQTRGVAVYLISGGFR